jgi:hypothetical protein
MKNNHKSNYKQGTFPSHNDVSLPKTQYQSTQKELNEALYSVVKILFGTCLVIQ